MNFRTRALVSTLTLFTLSSSWANASPIRVRLFFAGEPLTYISKPDFTLRTPQDWVTIHIAPNADGSFTMERPAPGAYMIHVTLDEDKSNPGDFPGDYNIFQEFNVTETEPDELIVHMSKMLHVTEPWDNAKGIEGMLTPPVDLKPLLKIPWHSAERKIEFVWGPITKGASYRYTLSREVKGAVTQLFQKDTSDTSVTVRLPPSNADELYHFNMFATKNGRTVGTLFVHDAGTQGWALKFRVGKSGVSVWTVLAGLALIVISVLALKSLRITAAFVVIGGLLLSAVGYLYFSGERTAKAAPSTPALETGTKRSGTDKSLIDEFKRDVPLPAWWADVEPELPIHSFSDIQSVWQSGGSMDETRGKRFYKSAYKAMEEHPDVPDLVPHGMYLMSVVAADQETRLALQKFWLDKFFYYQQRTDFCANCMVGDTTGDMVRDYAETIGGSDPAAGIAMIQKLIKERDKDVSPYNLAMTLKTQAWIQWMTCDKAGAIASLNDGLRRFPVGWQADELKKRLTEYESTVPNCTPREGNH